MGEAVIDGDSEGGIVFVGASVDCGDSPCPIQPVNDNVRKMVNIFFSEYMNSMREKIYKDFEEANS